MTQDLKFKIAGLYTAQNDLADIPPGALDVAENVEIRYKNLAEPRRGFENVIALTDHAQRVTNFPILNENSLIILTNSGSARDILTWNADNGLNTLSGDVPFFVSRNPDDYYALIRFAKAGQNLYCTTGFGVLSLASGTGSQPLLAGVPKGLDCSAVTTGSSGFLGYNPTLATTGNLTNASPTISGLASSAGIAVGNYVADTSNSSYIPAGTQVSSINQPATALIATGNSSIGSPNLTSMSSMIGLAAGYLVSGNGVPAGTTVTSANTYTFTCSAANATVGATYTNNGQTFTVSGTISGGTTLVCTGTGVPSASGTLTKASGTGDATITFSAFTRTVVMSASAVQDNTGATYTFSSPLTITMSNNATHAATSDSLVFYAGSQCSYRVVFGRVDTDVNGNSTTRLGAASQIAYCTNTSPHTVNASVTATVPRDPYGTAAPLISSGITFIQVYRSFQTAGASIIPLDQYELAYEGSCTPGTQFNFTDNTPDSLLGIPLYSGSDQEGALQSNDPPPMCYDMCNFRNYTLYANIYQPASLTLRILGTGAPNGIQIGDTLFIGAFASNTYTAAAAENLAAKQFKVFTSGTPAQNIADTAASLARCINANVTEGVHAILLSSTNGLAGEIFLESDIPGNIAPSIQGSHGNTAYFPDISSGIQFTINHVNNGVIVSKSQQFESCPMGNLLYVGNSDSPIVRVIPMRDFTFVIKTDGVYKIIGTDPNNLVVNPFDLTVKVVGADTPVSLNSSLWMLSKEGVVSLSDSGTQAISPPIDDQILATIAQNTDAIWTAGFGISYESDKKYILCLPINTSSYSDTEINFNYETGAWTTWVRDFYCAFIQSTDNKLYIGRADSGNFGISKERKSMSASDYADEDFDVTVTAVDSTGTILTVSDASDLSVGDFIGSSPILAINGNQLTVYGMGFSPGIYRLFPGINCTITWKQVYGDNAAFLHQFSEGQILFKDAQFNEITANFQTDFSQNSEPLTVTGFGFAAWGLFAWGLMAWGKAISTLSFRFYVPENKQFGSYIIPSITINQAFCAWKLQGLSISYNNESQEAGA